MVVVAKKDPTKPRRTVDFKYLNKVFTRQTHAGKYHYKVVPQGFLASQDGYNHRYDKIIQDIADKERCVDDTCLWDRFGDNKEKSISKHFFRTCQYILLCGKAGIIFSKKKFQFCQKQVELVLR